MRSTFTTTRNSFLSIIALLAFTTAFTSCSKKEAEIVGTGYVQVINGSPTTSPIDFYVDDIKKNSAALEYNQSTGYFALSTAQHPVLIKNSVSGTVEASFNIGPAPNSYNTLFYYDNYAAAYTDDTTAPKAGKARVRFIDLNLGITSNVDFGISGGAKLATNLQPGQASDYLDVDPAGTYAMYLTATTTTLITIPTTIEAGHIYTVYVSGATQPDIVGAVSLQK